MSWFFLAISGYFLYAVATVANKFLLRQRATTRPLVFTFWVGVTSIFVLILAPFGLSWPGTAPFLLDIFVGFLFFGALLAFYKSLDDNEASRSSAAIGGLVPIFVLALSAVFLGEKLAGTQFLAFCLLVLGGILISLKIEKGGFKEGMKDMKIAVLAILLSAVYYVFAKFIFDQQGFITAFVWSRIGLVLAASAILIRPSWRREIFHSGRALENKTGGLMILNKIAAAVGSLLVHLAIAGASVSLINALQGAEYAFLLVMTVLVSRLYPRVLKEKINRAILAQKILAILLIGAGLAVLSV